MQLRFPGELSNKPILLYCGIALFLGYAVVLFAALFLTISLITHIRIKPSKFMTKR